MKIEFLCKNYNASDKLKDIISHKVDKLDKFFEDDTKAKIMLKKSKDVETLEITIAVAGGIVRAEIAGENMYNNIDLAIPKLEKQIIRHHDKMKSKKFKLKELDFAAPLAQEAAKEPEKKVVRSKSYVLVPMTVGDAIEEMELVGHDFYVFANKATGNVNVLYSRNDGDYGLIEAVK
jgi:ribosomal subunit interface protein